MFFLNSFPGNFSYYGDAKICIGETEYLISLNLKVNFSDKTEVTALFEHKIESEFHTPFHIEDGLISQAKNIILRNKFILVGFVASTTSQYKEGRQVISGRFEVINVITLRSLRTSKTLQDGSLEHEILKPFQEENTFYLKFYLNKSFSSYSDRLHATENNVFYPSSGNRTSSFRNDSSNEKIYCRLNSGYLVRCGKFYVKHMNESPSMRSNYDLVYSLTFVELVLPLKKNEASESGEDSHVLNLVQELQKTDTLVNQICAFLSLVRDRETPDRRDRIHPLFFEYSINHEGQFISGFMIPVRDKLKLEKLDDGRNVTRVLRHCLEAILECCPLSERFSQGLFTLSNSLSVDVSNTKLISICSAIEYFFSYWIYELNGCEILQKSDRVSQKNKKHLEKAYESGKTPILSVFIAFFLIDIGVDISRHGISETQGILFLEFRNDILHGKFISEIDVNISGVVAQALHLSIDIMVSLLALVSRSGNKEIYASLKPEPNRAEYYSLLPGWDKVVEAMNEIYSTKQVKKYWTD